MAFLPSLTPHSFSINATILASAPFNLSLLIISCSFNYNTK
jgi:hypothetical protein